MTRKSTTQMDVGKRAWFNINISFPSWPEIPTTTVLALGFLLGNLLFLPMIAWLGTYIKAEFRDTVETIAGLFKDGMLLILGYYFAKVVNASQDRLVDKAMDAAAKGETR